jgi:hypothetical protein
VGKPNDKERKKGRNKEGRGPKPDKHNLEKLKIQTKKTTNRKPKERERGYPSLPIQTREVDESDRERRAKFEGKGRGGRLTITR